MTGAVAAEPRSLLERCEAAETEVELLRQRVAQLEADALAFVTEHAPYATIG